MVFILRKSIGIACTALGLFLLWASPVSTVSCSRGDDGVSCQVDRALLGVYPLDGVKVRHVLRAEVGHTAPPQPTSRTVSNAPPTNKTYELAFVTAEGTVAPRGIDASSAAPLREIADHVNNLVRGEGSPFSERNYNGFPTVAGSIFFFLGVIIVVNG
jgi:hypothetical protein